MLLFEKTKSLLLALILTLLPTPLLAGDLSLGAAVGYSSSPYKDTDGNFMPLPLINYDGDRFYVRGLGAGVYLWKQGIHALSVGASYMPMSFRPNDSDNWRLRQVDKRYAGLDLDLSYTLSQTWGVVSVALSREVLNDSGFGAGISYMYPFAVGNLHLSPQAGVDWREGRFNNYYFGISRSESLRSGLKEYDAEGSFNPYLGLNANYSLTEHWSLTGATRITVLGSEIRDSPMVDKSALFSGMAGVNYKF